MRLIDADDLKKTLRDWIRGYWTDDNVGSEFADMIDHAETIDSLPVVHAHWFTLDPNQRTGKAYKFVCSNCERAVFTPRQESINELGYVFCPHCGAKMEVGENAD